MMKIKLQTLAMVAMAALLAVPVAANDYWSAGLLARGNGNRIQPVSYSVHGNVDCDECGTCSDCTTSCDTCCADPCCCNPLWKHRCGVFAEFLYLRPGNVDVVYATEQTSFDPTLASPTGPIGRTNIDHGTGFRIGGAWALSDCASFVATYSWLESDTENTITATPENVMNLEVGHPSVLTSGSSSIASSAYYDLDFQTFDVDYKALLCGNCDAAVNYLVGLRYGHLSQDFLAEQEIFSAAGLTSVASEIDFDGYGIRFGLEGVKRRPCTGILLYAKGNANFMTGEFKANFVQTNQFGGAAVIRNDFEDYRVLSILEAELGMGWESKCGRFRVTGGYLFSGWFNTLTTRTYIDGVQQGTYTDLAETLTFDGFVTRFEFRY